MPLDNKNAFGEPDNTETRYDGITEQIDALLWMKHDTGSLSDDQRSQLAELREQVAAYGERGEKWAKECDRALADDTTRLESMMGFYTKFVHSFDCPTVLAEAATSLFKEILVEAYQSSDIAEKLRQKVGVNPNETRGVSVFGISGDDGLPQQATIDKAIDDAMVSGSFDALGEDIATADPNGFDETVIGVGSSELDDYGNDLNPEDWAAEETVTEEEAVPEEEDKSITGQPGEETAEIDTEQVTDEPKVDGEGTGKEP